MAIPRPTQPNPAVRTTQNFTVGEPNRKLEISTAASSFALGGTIITGVRPPLVGGVDYQTKTATIGALAAGASTTVSVTISFPGLPSPFVASQGDALTFLVMPSFSHSIAGLSNSSWTVTPQAISPIPGNSSAMQTFTGPKISGGITVILWRVVISTTFVAVTATSSGTLTVGASTILTVLPG